MHTAHLMTDLINQSWFQLIFVALFGFLTGLEFREYILERNQEKKTQAKLSFGTSRTFTFIAILGYLFYRLDPSLRLYLAGLFGLWLLLALFYFQKLQLGHYGLLQSLVALIVYSYGPMVVQQPPWFLILIFVAVVFTLSARKKTHLLVEKIDPQEIPTLAKFLLLSGVILPLLPDQQISPYLPVTPFKIWLAVVVISSISYLGYIVRKYLLVHQGYLLTGFLGGLYSSTAATVVLARKSRSLVSPDPSINAGIIAATGMMYLRLLVLIGLMQAPLILVAAPPLGGLSLLSLLIAVRIDHSGHTSEPKMATMDKSNPLELGIAFVFALLFVVMLLITQQVLAHFGQTGLSLLALVAGFSDIDPFVLSVLSGHYPGLTANHLVGTLLIAAGSNNLLKALYAFFVGDRSQVKGGFWFLVLAGVGTVALGLFMAR